jgi:hypothetical protein
LNIKGLTHFLQAIQWRLIRTEKRNFGSYTDPYNLCSVAQMILGDGI